MKYRPTPSFVTALVIIACLIWLALYIVGAIHIYQNAAGNLTQRVNPTPIGPDISHCFKPEETRELWDCIRHEEVDSG